jgi:hypothetical protein
MPKTMKGKPMTRATRRFNKKPVALIEHGAPGANLAAALAGFQTRSVPGPVAATPDVAVQLATDKAVQFHKTLAEHYKERAIKAEATVAHYAATVDQLSQQVRDLAAMLTAK